MTGRVRRQRGRRDRLTFGEVAAMMRQPSYWRPAPPPPALHQMAKARLMAAGAGGLRHSGGTEAGR